MKINISGSHPKIYNFLPSFSPQIGIVGRTGAGKTTLTAALFRMLEPVSGSVKIDGVDLSLLGLHDLRARLTLITQEPVLFEGTLRANLDPLEQCGDAQVWAALEQAHLKNTVEALPEGLDTQCGSGGKIFRYELVNYLFKNGLGSHVIVFRLHCCLSYRKNQRIYYDQLVVSPILYIVNAIVPRAPAQRGSRSSSRSSDRSSSRSSPGVATLTMDLSMVASNPMCYTMLITFWKYGNFNNLSSSIHQSASRRQTVFF